MSYSNQLNAAEQAAYDLWKLEEKRFVLLQFIIGEAAASKRVDNAVQQAKSYVIPLVETDTLAMLFICLQIVIPATVIIQLL